MLAPTSLVEGQTNTSLWMNDSKTAMLHLMILLAWNCRELGTTSRVRKLGEVILEQSPAVVFLSETKCGYRRVEMLKQRFDLFGICVPSKGRSWGLALLWKKDVVVQLRSFSRFHVDVEVMPSDMGSGGGLQGSMEQPIRPRVNKGGTN
ncbi:UNVERIFIED_CONTAM: hypothetical protein Slati_1359100 [Sesamum latifolium]|uniref:Endonuclease/exonuclease/phosphatase domain-containing protein n=1 Tax=Sesamum latifolium TaxID=2727402 RepID=A0AAW2XPS6_9LAMI